MERRGIGLAEEPYRAQERLAHTARLCGPMLPVPSITFAYYLGPGEVELEKGARKESG